MTVLYSYDLRRIITDVTLGLVELPQDAAVSRAALGRALETLLRVGVADVFVDNLEVTQ